MGRRTDTNKPGSVRSSRMYEEGEDWYFRTREGTAAGPFRDEFEAYTQLEIYIRMAESGLLPAVEVAAVAKRAKTAS